MSLLQEWREGAYALDTSTREGQLFWGNYFNEEKEIYIKLLEEPNKVWQDTVENLAKEFDMDFKLFIGFLDGINDSLVNPNPIEDMDKDSIVCLTYDKEKLYYNMVAAKADWLYDLPQWEQILTQERRKELYMEQKKSGTIVNDKKIGRNDPCSCGSGKKYKKCCGK